MDRYPPTDEQQRVIAHRGSNVLVFAGPGTGKTETLARRFASLVADGVRADRILVLMFSRRSASEMMDRVVTRLRERLGRPLAVPELYVSTFHSFCRRLLEAGGPRFADRTLLTPVRERLLWRQVVESRSLRLDSLADDVRQTAAFATDCLNIIGQLKGRGIDERRLRAVAGDDARLRDIAAIYEALEAQRVKRELSDLRDLVNEAVKALDGGGTGVSPSLAWLRAAAFEHVLVDEFQDSDGAQLDLLRRVRDHSARPPEFCFVGDTNQAIYRFRGASPDNVARAREEFQCASLSLRQNRRSAQAVLDAANETTGLDPGALTEAADLTLRGTVAMHVADDQRAEVEHICDTIAARVAAGADPSAIAVLMRRTRPYQHLIAHGLRERGVPVATGAATDFADDPVVDVILTALRLLVDPYDREAAYRLLTDPIIGFQALDVRLAFHVSRSGSALDALAAAPPRGKRDWAAFDRAWRALAGIVRTATLPELVRAVAFELDVLAPARGADARGYETLGSPARLAAIIGAAEDYLAMLPRHARGLGGARLLCERVDETIGLLAEASSLVPPAAPGVRVMSVHASKGLEFDTVVVPELIEGVFPASERPSRLLPRRSAARLRAAGIDLFATGADADQEERSLYYVALTRARTDVLLTAARHDDEGIETTLSRFVGSMEATSCGGTGVSRSQTPPPVPEPADPIRVTVGSLSPTSVGDFLKCPRQFYYRHVLMLPQELDEDTTRFGSAAHDGLRRFHETHTEFSGAATLDPAALLGDLLRDGEAALADEWRRSNLAPESALARYERARMTQRLTGYVAWLLEESRARPFEVVACEHVVEGSVAGVDLHGKVDRVDRLADGTLAIRDYKSGKQRSKLVGDFLTVCAGERVPFGAVPRTLNLQLLLYVPLVESALGGRVSRVSYLYLNGSNDDAALAPDDTEIAADGTGAASQVPPQLTRSEIAGGLERVLRGIVEMCGGGDRSWFPTALDDEMCEFCAYVKTCPGAGTIRP